MARERLRIELPPETRRRLRAVAKRLEKTESDVARDLLIDVLARREKDELYRRASDQMTPELRERLLAIAEAFEHLEG